MRKKLLLLIFSIVSCVCLAFGFAACSSGVDGQDGIDGTTITSITPNYDAETGSVASYTILYSDGQSFTIVNGEDGATGETGADGNGIESITSSTSEDGLTVTYTIKFTDPDAEDFVFVVQNGKDGQDGKDGEDGTTLTSITPNYDIDGTTIISYTIVYSDGSTFTIYNGTDGKDGEALTATVVTLTFDLGYDINDTIESIELSKGDSVDLPEPERDGYIFLGWYYGTGANAGLVTSVTPITRDMTVTAQWERVYNIELTSVTSSTCVGNDAWFYGNYEGGFTTSSSGLLTIYIIADGETYTATQAYNLGLIYSSYSYCEMSGYFEGYVNFSAIGDYTVQIIYGNSSVQYDISVGYFVYSSTPESEIYVNDDVYFSLYYYGDSEYDYPTITVANDGGYTYTYEITNTGSYYDYDNEGISCVDVVRLDYGTYNRLRGYVYFYVSGEYTVTVTYGEDSTSFNVTVEALPTYISYIGTAVNGWSYGDEYNTDVNYFGDAICAYDVGAYIEIEAENAEITVTLDGVELTAAEVTYFYEEGSSDWYDYSIAEGGDYYVIAYGDSRYELNIYSAVFVEGVTNVIVVTAVGENGTATATLNLTVTDWIWNSNPDGDSVYESDIVCFDLYYFGASEYDYPTITVVSDSGYTYTYEVINTGSFYNYYDNDGTTYFRVRWDDYGSVSWLLCYAYFYVSGEYTVTITYGEDSTSFNVTVEAVSAYVGYIETATTTVYGYEDVVYTGDAYNRYYITVGIYNRNAEVTVTLDGIDLTEADYSVYVDGNYNNIHIDPSVLAEGVTNVIVVTAVGENGTATATLYLTLSDWAIYNNSDGNSVYESDYVYFELCYLGDSEYDYPTITVESDNGYTYTYEVTTTDSDYYIYDDDNTTYIYVFSGSDGYIYSVIWFNVAGDYTVTLNYGNDSISFSVVVSEYPFDGDMCLQNIYCDNYGYVADGAELTSNNLEDNYLEFMFYAPLHTNVTVTIDGTELASGYYAVEWSYNTLVVYFYPNAVLELGTHTITVTVEKDGYETVSSTITYIFTEYEYEGVAFNSVSYDSDSGEYSYIKGVTEASESITINGRTEIIYYFIPATSGTITTYTESDIDTYGYLYEDGVCIASNDDYNGLNFRIIYEVTAGTLYEIRVRGFSDSTSGSATLYISGVAFVYGDSADISLSDLESEDIVITDYVDGATDNTMCFTFMAALDSVVTITVDGVTVENAEAYSAILDTGVLTVYINPKLCTGAAAGTYAIEVSVSSENYGASDSALVTYNIVENN